MRSETGPSRKNSIAQEKQETQRTKSYDRKDEEQTMRTISLREEIIARGPLLGLVVMYESPGALERIGPDWDWVWIDGQHGQLGYRDTLHLVRTCDLIGRPSLLRVAGHDAGAIGMALDTGAHGVIVPCVDSPEQARRLVEAAKFPPLGKRSYGGRRPIDLEGRNYVEKANENTLLVAQIETPEAIDCVEEIAAVPGVDALFLGPDDLMWRRGHSMTEPRTRATMEPDMRRVATACKNHGKLAVMVGVGAEMLSLSLELGFHLIVSGGDVPFLANGSAQASRQAREVLSHHLHDHLREQPVVETLLTELAGYGKAALAQEAAAREVKSPY